MLQRHQLEVDGLHEGPDHVVGGQGAGVVLLELVADRVALQDRHGAQENADGTGGEDTLVEADTSEGGGVGGLEVDVLGQELEPDCGSGAEDGWKGLVTVFRNYE